MATPIVCSEFGLSSEAKPSSSEAATSKPLLNPMSAWPTRRSEQPTARTRWSTTAPPGSSWRSESGLEQERRRRHRRRGDLERDHLVGLELDLRWIARVQLRSLVVAEIDIHHKLLIPCEGGLPDVPRVQRLWCSL